MDIEGLLKSLNAHEVRNVGIGALPKDSADLEFLRRLRQKQGFDRQDSQPDG